MTQNELKAIVMGSLLSRGTWGEDDIEAASNMADTIIGNTAGEIFPDEMAEQFAESILGDMATDMEGDPDKIRNYWRQIRTIVDRETS